MYQRSDREIRLLGQKPKTRAVNQHAALMAVAEAAKLNDSCWLAGKWEDNDRLAPIEARIELHNALAALNP